MNAILGKLVIIIAVTIFTIYNKIMKVWYSSSMAFLYEIVEIVFIAIILAMILTNLLGSIHGRNIFSG